MSKKRLVLYSSLFSSSLFTLSYYFHFFQGMKITIIQKSVLLVYLFLLMAGVYCFFYLKLHSKFHKEFSLSKMIFPIISFMLCLVIGFTFSPPVQFAHNVVVKSLGNHNNVSKGNEVWLNGMSINKKPVSVNEFTLDTAWEIRDGVALSYQNQPGNLIWFGKASDKIEFVFVTSPWSGIVQVSVDNQTKTVDLYSVANSKTKITIPLVDLSNDWREKLIKFSDSFLMFTFLLLIFYIISKN